MTKLEFPLEPYMLFRLGKLPLIYAAGFCIEFYQALLMPYERFVMLYYTPPTYALLHWG
jgi:hypothetical protein